MVATRYYARYDESGRLYAIGTGLGGVDITEAEYNALLAEIREKAELVNQLYSGEITAEEVPEEWREEVERRVNERVAIEGEVAEQEISGEDFLSMLEEVL